MTTQTATFPNKWGDLLTVPVYGVAAGFCIHAVSRGYRITRVFDGRYVADFPTLEGASTVLAQMAAGMPNAATVRAWIEQAGGTVAE